jgi:hypothetical protein
LVTPGRKIIAALVGALVLATPSAASASQVIGQTATGIPNTGCPGNTPWAQASIGVDPSYSPSSYGVITSFSAKAGPSATQSLKLLVLQPGSGNQFSVVARDVVRTLSLPSAVNTFTGMRLQIEPTQRLGLFVPAGGTGPCDWVSTTPGDVVSNPLGAPGEPADNVSVSYTGSTSSRRLNASAVVEPDSDHDVFGDETQDKCVGTPGTANGCPSTVSIDGLKQKGNKKVKVTVTVPGAGTLAVGSASDPALASAEKAQTVKAVTQTLTSTRSQQVTLAVKLTKSAKSKLAAKGKLKLQVKAVYTPAGGPPASQTQKKKLRS